MFKKVLLLGTILTSLSLSVAATQVQFDSFESVKFVVESTLDKTLTVVLDNEPINLTHYIVAAKAINVERILNVTGENTQLTDSVIDETIELVYQETNLATANPLPQEVGWQF